VVPNGEVILYQAEDGQTNIEVQLSGETVWLSTDKMAQLFQRDKSVIAKHIKNIFKEGELQEDSVVAKFATTADDGKVYQIAYYNLDMIISLGYRVNSYRAVQFRIWATKTLKEYIIKGFAIDDDRLSGKRTNYFDELIERVRRIRTSEANFYEKVKAIFATSIDYDSSAEPAQLFYKTVQNKFHYAITGMTAAEIISSRVNAYKPRMGLVTTKGDNATRQEAKIAKNYLEELELKRLELLVDQFLSFAQLQSIEKRPMYMADWLKKLDDFIVLNDKKILQNAGSISHASMENIVDSEFEIYARKLVEEGSPDGTFTKADFEKALRKITRKRKSTD
jgi:hypothetical protein